jgi:L-alanine-DL-glutamate epimerase-like enolase superfamily enzyme
VTVRRDGARVDHVEAAAYAVPTDAPESDGTFAWQKTTLVVVHVQAGGERGIGYTYADRATAHLVNGELAEAVRGEDAMSVPRAFARMSWRVRNLGRSGVAAMAISAVDAALWDLKARLLGLPLVQLLGAARAGVPVYGSGGFTSYSDARLEEQLGGWAAHDIPRVKMKVGPDPRRDVDRVRVARRAVGDGVELFVDANGAYDRKQALEMAFRFRDLGVVWFEEPVSSDDLAGLRLVRDGGPGGMSIAAGEYGYDPFYFRRMLDADAVDTLQADASRCGGVTGFLDAAALCRARPIALSAHCAPSLHAHVACAAPNVVHLEYFHDHVRIEHMLFDGALLPARGELVPDLSRPGMGIELRRSDAERYAI